MGGGYSSIQPVRRSSRPVLSTSSAPVEPIPAQDVAVVEPAQEGLPTYISVGGGLSPSRIVRKLPDTLGSVPLGQATLGDVISYVTGTDIATSEADQLIAGNINDRLAERGSKFLINDRPELGRAFNLGIDQRTQPLDRYLVKYERNLGDGNMIEVNFADLKVVTEAEGGRYMSLERMLR